MKLKDIEVGQIVVDKYGNEYVVEMADNHPTRPVLLKCIKFLNIVRVQKIGDVKFHNVNDSFWIYKSAEVAMFNGCDLECITVESLKLKGVSK